MAEEYNRKADEAIIHGGGVKIGRLHFAILELKRGRRERNNTLMYDSLEDLWTELEAWANDKERTELLNLFKQLSELYSKINKGFKDNEPAFRSDALLFELKLRRVMKKSNLDAGLKNKEVYLSGAI